MHLNFPQFSLDNSPHSAKYLNKTSSLYAYTMIAMQHTTGRVQNTQSHRVEATAPSSGRTKLCRRGGRGDDVQRRFTIAIRLAESGDMEARERC